MLKIRPAAGRICLIYFQCRYFEVWLIDRQTKSRIILIAIHRYKVQSLTSPGYSIKCKTIFSEWFINLAKYFKLVYSTFTHTYLYNTTLGNIIKIINKLTFKDYINYKKWYESNRNTIPSAKTGNFGHNG